MCVKRSLHPSCFALLQFISCIFCLGSGKGSFENLQKFGLSHRPLVYLIFCEGHCHHSLSRLTDGQTPFWTLPGLSWAPIPQASEPHSLSTLHFALASDSKFLNFQIRNFWKESWTTVHSTSFIPRYLSTHLNETKTGLFKTKDGNYVLLNSILYWSSLHLKTVMDVWNQFPSLVWF